MAAASYPTPAPASMEEAMFRASFRRGRMLVWALLVITAVGYLASTLRGYFGSGNPATLTNLLSGWALVGFICWRVSRGGPFAIGCLVVPCVLMALGLFATLVGMTLTLVPFVHSSFDADNFHDLGRDRKATLSFLAGGLWAAYGCWVLLISKDARLYMNARHHEEIETDASAFEWNRDERRQERPSDAP